VAFFGFRGTRQWEFARFRVDSEEAEAGTIDMMEADGWEYLTTDSRNNSEWAVFKKYDGISDLQPKFPVWDFGKRRRDAFDEYQAGEKYDRTKKMTSKEKVGKRGR
jgi:hypothetical protein